MDAYSKTHARERGTTLSDRLARNLVVAETILRNRVQFFSEIRDGIRLQEKTRAMLVASAAFTALYGAVLGSSHGPLQVLSSAVKLPILFLVTSIICLPTLYFFNTLFGAKQNLSQILALLLMPITVTGVILLSFAPITLFFRLTTDVVNGYQFFKLLNVAIFAISGSIGMWFLWQGMRLVSGAEEENIRIRRLVLAFWILMFAFVGSQMAWTLRPFVGYPYAPFEILRQTGGNFYADVLRSVGELLGFFVVR